MIITNAWYVAAWSHEVTSVPMARRICNKPLVLFRSVTGEACALIDSCSHRGAPLSLGTVTEKGIRCNYHGVVFGCRGECIEVPNQAAIPTKARVDWYPLVERDQILWIWMGAKELVDDSLIPAYPFHNDPLWPSTFAMASVASNYLLIADNLLDATHLAYVHGGTVGGSNPHVHMVAQNTLKPTARGLRYERLMLDAPPPPAYLNCVDDLPARIDRWQEFDFHAPSTVLQYSGGVAAGADRATAPAPRFDMRIFHSATPATDTSCYYFYSVQNGHRVEDPAANRAITEEIALAIAEDKMFIEAQQQRVQELGEERLFDNAADAARIMARRTIAKYAQSLDNRPENG
ncbi:aromatic ring-hydroxylating dioxygenase subunit alpha [Alteraurantiacibacter buctensis]|uniref:Rieske 2Fe-2S domain-containing protein n=1 Tax=Alteraurantiacibacter buctensis TaxID=1503981 RepID=A0A844Z189_9SPHN|nr:aromatic ring-hydroxylating dioxygenase subunit alpha [Alteraurantiacibacter buctensis]MXO73016.1 Rieske 2Fe-2S domain-containing protein [Alteraurantiacibacter buctensis]